MKFIVLCVRLCVHRGDEHGGEHTNTLENGWIRLARWETVRQVSERVSN